VTAIAEWATVLLCTGIILAWGLGLGLWLVVILRWGRGLSADGRRKLGKAGPGSTKLP
jgi:hypothetical protein